MQRQSHKKRIYEALAQRIQRGEVSWSDRLVDIALAAEMGVSRMPVRDALLRLAAEGYLVPTTRGFSLPDLDNDEVLQIFELRRLLEPRAAGLAAQAMDEATLAALRNAVGDGRAALAAGDISGLFRASEIFRNGWLSIVPNRMLVETIRRYFTQVQKVRLTTMRDLPTLHVIVEGQTDLLQTFERHDSIAAADRMLAFVVSGELAFRKLANSAS